MSKFRELMGEIDKKNGEVIATFDKIDGENRDATTEEVESVRSLNKDIAELEKKAAGLREGEEMRAAAEARRTASAAANRLPVGDGKGEAPPNPSQRYAEARKSLGEKVVSEKGFQDWLRSLAPTGRIPDRITIQSPSIPVRTLITGASDTSAGAAVQIDYKPLVNGAPFKPLTLRDLITIGETGSDAIEFARITGYTNNAAAVPEATTAAAINGTTVTNILAGLKPESAMTMEKVTEVVKTVAHWIPATNRALSDVAQLRTLIDAFLIFGLEERGEALMLSGDGVGENFLGILNTPGIQAQAYATDILTTLRKARTKVRVVGKTIPTAYLLSPNDWETIDLSKNLDGDFYFGGPSALGIPRVWGLPVVENQTLADGVGICADWKYAVLWDRMQASISVSNSHADFFVRNLVAILAEMRAAFGVTYTKAFCSIDLTAA